MKKNTSSKHNPILAIVLILSTVLAAVGGTLAIYSSQAIQRSVVRNRDTEAIRFSSDRLFLRDDLNYPNCPYLLPENSDHTMTFYVCNYDQDKSALHNESDITYDITFTINDGTKDFTYEIAGQNNGTAFTPVSLSNSGTETLKGHTLSGEKSSSNFYSIKFSPDDYAKVHILVSVTPHNTTATKSKTLRGTLTPIQYAKAQGFTVNAEYPDSLRTSNPTQLAAYNLLVSVSGGEQQVTIQWDKDKVVIDPFFLEENTPDLTPDERSQLSEITLTMNSLDENGSQLTPSSQLIQFYNYSAPDSNWQTWMDLPITVNGEKPSSYPAS